MMTLEQIEGRLRDIAEAAGKGDWKRVENVHALAVAEIAMLVEQTQTMRREAANRIVAEYQERTRQRRQGGTA